MNLQEKIVSGDGDWFKVFATEALNRCVGMTRDQIVVYLVSLLLEASGAAADDPVLFRRKLVAYTALAPGRLDRALEGLPNTNVLLSSITPEQS